MAVGTSMPIRRLLGLLMASFATLVLAPAAMATTDGASVTQYSFVDSEDPLGPTPGQWENLGPNGTDLQLAGTDDALSDPQDLTFNFMFFGQSYRLFRACSNGFITFGPGTTAFDNQPIPTRGLPEAMIAPFWDDLFVPDLTVVPAQFQIFGAAPTAALPVGSRHVVITYDAVTFFNDQTGQFDSLGFQIVLFEGSNDIEFRYRAPRGSRGVGRSATIGLEDETGTYGNEYEHDGVPEANLIYDGLVIRWTSYTTSVPNLNQPVANGQYTAIENDARHRKGGNSGSQLCFVTNAAYGSPLAEEVRVLCRFRDVYLMPTGAGREFVDFYYRSSPPLARMIGSDEGFKLPIQMALRPPIWLASFLLFSTAAEKAVVAVLVLVLGMFVGRAMCRRLADPEA